MADRFELSPSDGIHGAQVWVCNDDDLQYWQNQADKNGYQMVFDYHAPMDLMTYEPIEHDVYQILPPKQAENFRQIKGMTPCR